MSKRRYKIVITDIEVLAVAYPKAVEEVEIPASIKKKAVYTVIAKLLDCGLEVPGIEIVLDEDKEETDALSKKSKIAI